MALQNKNNAKSEPPKRKINNFHKALSLILAKFKGVVLNMD
jgi:hypothetical protein